MFSRQQQGGSLGRLGNLSKQQIDINLILSGATGAMNELSNKEMGESYLHCLDILMCHRPQSNFLCLVPIINETSFY